MEDVSLRILLDTCAILWAAADPEKLSSSAKQALLAPDSEICVCPMSAAEIACAEDRGRIRLKQHWKTWFREQIKTNQWEIIPLDLPVVEEAYCLPAPFHKDPVDRLLVALARIHNLRIITGDQLILSYPHVDCIW